MKGAALPTPKDPPAASEALKLAPVILTSPRHASPANPVVFESMIPNTGSARRPSSSFAVLNVREAFVSWKPFLRTTCHVLRQPLAAERRAINISNLERDMHGDRAAITRIHRILQHLACQTGQRRAVESHDARVVYASFNPTTGRRETPVNVSHRTPQSRKRTVAPPFPPIRDTRHYLSVGIAHAWGYRAEKSVSGCLKPCICATSHTLSLRIPHASLTNGTLCPPTPMFAVSVGHSPFFFSRT